MRSCGNKLAYWITAESRDLLSSRFSCKVHLPEVLVMALGEMKNFEKVTIRPPLGSMLRKELLCDIGKSSI